MTDREKLIEILNGWACDWDNVWDYADYLISKTEKGENVPKVLAILALTISAAVAVKIDVWWLIGLYWAAVAVYWMNK